MINKTIKLKTTDLVTKGPLRRCEKNPRYFSHDGIRPVYLAASHTWNNLVDMGRQDPPRAFNFEAYLDFLAGFNHNFIRLWTFESSQFKARPKEKTLFVRPLPWPRIGPGLALDGKPKFDLGAFDPEYFRRLRGRVEAASARGIYVSIMLFEGWVLSFAPPPEDWQYHPFNKKNNVNGIDADRDRDGHGREYHMLAVPKVTVLQEAYVRKVIDTVNDLDNVLYEISNESAFAYSAPWQYHLIRFIKQYEADKPKQHPVGMTGYGPSENNVLYNSPADWISPGLMTRWQNDQDPFMVDPPVADGNKVSLLDTDHIWGMGGKRQWVWKSFLRGHNPLYMEYWPEKVETSVFSAGCPEEMKRQTPGVRRNLGYTRYYAQRINLAAMLPCNHLCLSTFCLADPGREYLCYLPKGGKTAVDLSGAKGTLGLEWFNPAIGKIIKTGSARGGDIRQFKTPWKGDAVLYLKSDNNGEKS
jgi:hypothetical protein